MQRLHDTSGLEHVVTVSLVFLSFCARTFWTHLRACIYRAMPVLTYHPIIPRHCIFWHSVDIPFFEVHGPPRLDCNHYQRFSVGAWRNDWVTLITTFRTRRPQTGCKCPTHFPIIKQQTLQKQAKCHLHMHTSVYQIHNLSFDPVSRSRLLPTSTHVCFSLVLVHRPWTPYDPAEDSYQHAHSIASNGNMAVPRSVNEHEYVKSMNYRWRKTCLQLTLWL